MQDPTLTQARHVINGETINGKLQAPEGTIARFVREQTLDDQVIDRLYLAALSRLPSADEKTKIAAALRDARHDPQKSPASSHARKQPAIPADRVGMAGRQRGKLRMSLVDDDVVLHRGNDRWDEQDQGSRTGRPFDTSPWAVPLRRTRPSF